MPLKRQRGRPKKATGTTPSQPTAPTPLKRGHGRRPGTEPTPTSSLPASTKRKRGRPAKNEHDTTSPATASAARKRGKPTKKLKAPVANRRYAAKRILDENETQYLIDWDENDPNTGKPYKPSWHPKICANTTLVAEWEDDKQEEWAAKGILDEKPHYYLIAWETDPKTNEVYRDTWEPKSFASKSLVNQWKQLQAKRKAASQQALDSRPTGDNGATASDAGSAAPSEEEDENEEVSEDEENEGEGTPEEEGTEVPEEKEDENAEKPKEKEGENEEIRIGVGAEAPVGTNDVSQKQTASETGTGASSPLPSPSSSPSRNEADTDEDKSTPAATSN